MFSRKPQYQTPLAMSTQAELVRLAAETNMNTQQLQQTAQVQGAMQYAAEQQQHIEIPKVNFFPSQHPNPRKRRRQDIKQAYRLLKPMKRRWWSPRRWLWGGKYRYAKNTAQCVVDGCDVDKLLRTVGNVYNDIYDEDTGKSLWEMYFMDPVTEQPRAFLAREGVTSGRTLTGTYCPEHLHLYHLLCKWEAEEEQEKEARTGTLKDKLKRGVSTVSVPISVVKKKDNTPEQLLKYEEFFRMCRADGIPIAHFKNKETGLNDITVITFDARQYRPTGDHSPLLSVGTEPSIMQQLAQAPAGSGLQVLLNEAQQQEAQFDAPEVPTQVS
tara:strand:+ start:10783 stop:11763 length:981 start_codon:yes stop_codon:yes gene_type:complete